jgi:hypothetical protein
VRVVASIIVGAVLTTAAATYGRQMPIPTIDI